MIAMIWRQGLKVLNAIVVGIWAVFIIIVVGGTWFSLHKLIQPDTSLWMKIFCSLILLAIWGLVSFMVGVMVSGRRKVQTTLVQEDSPRPTWCPPKREEIRGH